MWRMMPGDLAKLNQIEHKTRQNAGGTGWLNPYLLAENLVTHTARKLAKQYVQFVETGLSKPPLPMPGNNPLMLYLHIPFCEELCTYCSFHRVKFQPDLARAYFASLRKEIQLYSRQGDYRFKTLYIGGGTPTVLLDELVTTIEWVKQFYTLEEISVETNPNHLTRGNLLTLKNAGVDRLSVGVQTFDDGILRITGRYGRYGSGEEIISRLQAVHGIIKTLNVDMIFNYPGQTDAGLQRDLAMLLQLKADQVTFYPLMLAESTRGKIERTMGMVSDERGRRLYGQIAATMSKKYKLSTAWCFSLESAMIDEYIVTGEEYAGMGSGAFGYLDGCAYANTFNIAEYIQRVEEGQFAIAANRRYSRVARLMYDFMMQFFGLRIDTNHLRRKYGVSCLVLYPALLFFWLIGGIGKCRQSGIYSISKPYYGVIMMREFFTAVNNFRDYCRKAAGC